MASLRVVLAGLSISASGYIDQVSNHDLTPLSFVRKALGFFSFLLLGLILIPVPHAFLLDDKLGQKKLMMVKA